VIEASGADHSLESFTRDAVLTSTVEGGTKHPVENGKYGVRRINGGDVIEFSAGDR